MMNECPKSLFVFLVFLRVTGSCTQLEGICVCVVCARVLEILCQFTVEAGLHNSVMKAVA